MSQHKSQQYDFPKQPWECLILNINNLIWKISVGMFDLVYLKFIHIFSFSLHRLVKSNHAETFHLKVFSLSPGGLKTWKFYYCQMWGCFCEVRRLEITVISRFAIICLLSNGRETTPVRVRLQKLFWWQHLFFLACRPVEKIVYFCLSQIWYLWPCLRQPSSHNRRKSSCD